jgi:TRAP-type C4-dicarboxylate transport system permease small subunit
VPESHERAGAGDAPVLLRWLAIVEIAVVGAILVTSLCVTLDAIVVRNLGQSTGDWTLKLPELMLGWLTYIGMGALVTERGHVAAHMFLRKLPARLRRWAEVFSDVVTIVVLVVIIVGAVSIVKQQIEIGATDQELNDIASWVLLAVLPAGLALTVLHLLGDIYVVLRRRILP